MAFLAERLNDTKIIFATKGGHRWSTNIVQTNGGQEQRNSVWMYPRGEWEFDARKVLEAEAHYLRNFFQRCKGMLIPFLFRDWADYQDDGMGILNANGFGTRLATAQLFKRYGDDEIFSLRIIQKPVEGTVKVYVDGVLYPATVNYATGVVSFTPLVKTVTAAHAVGTTEALLTIPAHGFTLGDKLTFTLVGGTWPSLNPGSVIGVVDADTISIAVDASAFGTFLTGTSTWYPQERSALTWTGEFDVPVRFDSDDIDLSMSAADVIAPGVLGRKAFDVGAYKIIEVKL